MNIYLQSLVYWNLFGSILLLLFLNEELAHKILIDWAKIYKVKYELGYFGRLWLVWAAGLNIFFSIIHIKSVDWAIVEMKQFLVIYDIAIYLVFICLGIWGYGDIRQENVELELLWLC